MGRGRCFTKRRRILGLRLAKGQEGPSTWKRVEDLGFRA